MALADFTTDINGRIISFDGNTALKGQDQPLAYTKEHVQEMIRCKSDWKYFAENYYYILSLKEGMIKVKLRDYQTEIIQNFIDKRFNIVLASRQCVDGGSVVKIRNKKTGETREITIESAFNMLTLK